MTISIRGVPTDGALSDRIVRQMRAALARLRVRPVAGQVAFFNDNGPKGGAATRCALTVRLPYRPPTRVEHTAQTARLAFDGSFAALKRQLARYRERHRERRRRMKTASTSAP